MKRPVEGKAESVPQTQPTPRRARGPCGRSAPDAGRPRTPSAGFAGPTDNGEARRGAAQKEDIDQPGSRGAGALLGRGSRFEGKLTFEGTVEIEGQFVGDIISRGHLTVGKDAKVEGTIQVQSAVFSGEVGGSITTAGALELKSTARVTGDLNVETLVVEKGAFFEGTVKMRKGGGQAPMRAVTADAGEAPPVVAPPKRTV